MYIICFNAAHTQYDKRMWKSPVLKDVDTSHLVKLQLLVSTHAITLIRQSRDENGSAYLCYDKVISVIDWHRYFF